MNWDQIKKQYYRPDGTYRDLVVEGMDALAWQNLVEFLGERGQLTFRHRENDTETTLERINLAIVERQWAMQDYVPMARLEVAPGAGLDLYFFTESELEATLDPREIKNEACHTALCALIQEMASLLERPVRLCQENNREKVLFEILPRPKAAAAE